MMTSLRSPRPVSLLRLSTAGLAFLLCLAVAYKIKRMLQINVFPDIDMVPDEALKAFLHYDALKAAAAWLFHLVF